MNHMYNFKMLLYPVVLCNTIMNLYLDYQLLDNILYFNSEFSVDCTGMRNISP